MCMLVSLHAMLVETRGQLVEADELLPPRGSWYLTQAVRLGGSHLYPPTRVIGLSPYFLRHLLLLSLEFTNSAGVAGP